MEDILAVYTRPRDPDMLLVCLDETSKQLIAETRAPIKMKERRPARFDYEYERNGTANLFMMFASLVGWRHVKVTDRHTAVDYAHALKDLADIHFLNAKKIALVQDNLNTHTKASLYDAFPAAEARRLAAGMSGGARLTQLHQTGSIWDWDGAHWNELDNNPLTMQIASASVTGGARLHQLHRTGSIWSYIGPPCVGGNCPGWAELDNNPLTVKIVAAGLDLYQLHSDGTIWKYAGVPFSGWEMLDNNPRTIDIVASPAAANDGNLDGPSALYQLHDDGTIWKYTGPPMTGWQLLDNNPTTAKIVADNVVNDLYQIHIDGSIWRYTGTPLTGWQMLDNNPALNDGANYLHAVEIATGVERQPPVRVAGAFQGVNFDARCQRNRPGLLLLNGNVYLGFGTFNCDQGLPDGTPYHGWIFGYKASDLTPAGVFCTSPTGGGAGVWQSGGGLVGGADGAIYFETGNDLTDHHAALGDSFIKLPTTATGFGAPLHFTPSNAATLRDGGPLSPAATAFNGGHPNGVGDTDLGSGGPLLLPSGRLIGGGKQGRYYVINTATMALSQNALPQPDGFDGFQAFENTYHPDFTIQDYEMGEVFGPNIHSAPVYWSGTSYVYQMPEKDFLKAFHYDTGSLMVNTTPAAIAAGSWAKPPYGMPGGFCSISANGASGGVIWTCLPQNDGQWSKVGGALAAFDGVTLQQLWSDDSPVSFAKFAPPTIADGRVVRPTFSSDVHHGIPGKIVVYGIRPLVLPPIPHLYPWPLYPILPDPPDPERAAAVEIAALASAYGGSGGRLGTPTGPLTALGDGVYIREFSATVKQGATCHAPNSGGSRTIQSAVYYSPKIGAHAVSGEILAKWRELGGAKGSLGLPIAPEKRMDLEGGIASHFENGVISWSPTRGVAVKMK
jgi:hypothetical protein